jgi:hypothetical protein
MLAEAEAIPLSPEEPSRTLEFVEAQHEPPEPAQAPEAESPPAPRAVDAEAPSAKETAEAEPVAAPAEEPPVERARRSPFDAIWPPRERARGATDADDAAPQRDGTAEQSAEPAAVTEETPVAEPDVSTQPQDAAVEAPTDARPATAEMEPAAFEAVSILKSGVIDGMGYTLYSDGSIEAELPSGTIRFASIGELRLHLERAG